MNEVKFQQAAAKYTDHRERLKDSLSNLEDCNDNLKTMQSVRDHCWKLFREDSSEFFLANWIQLSQAISLASIAQTLLEMKIQKGGQ